jgi:hypothetical protein
MEFLKSVAGAPLSKIQSIYLVIYELEYQLYSLFIIVGEFERMSEETTN